MNYFFLLDLFMEHLDRWEYKSWLDQPRRHCCARRDLSTVVTNGPCHYPIGTDDVLDSSLTHSRVTSVGLDFYSEEEMMCEHKRFHV